MWYNAPYQTGNKKRPKNLLLAFENKEHYSVYSKDDLWAISGDPDFTTTFIGRSQFYGASRNSVMEIIPMSPHDTTLANTLLTTTHTAWALRVASASSDILMMDNLRDNLGRTGLLTTVLDPSAGGGGAGGTGGTGTAKAKAKGRGFKAPSSAALVDGEKLEDYWRVMADVAGSYGLNESQREVLTQFASSIAVPGTPPICLAHGVFGAGKSFLVSVIVIFLHKAMASGCLRKPDKFKVLVASMTNVAVDRILLELLRLEFRDFVRVGSLKKIAKPVLPFTAQAKNDHEDTRDLQDLLNGELTPEERRDVEETMAKFKKNMNKSITEKAFLVGATCLATTFESFDWYQNTVVILDECSQMTEPMSLLPLARFGSQKALLVGDPLQLPPTIPTTADPSRKDGLERTLFERLAESGLTPVLLRTQYRVSCAKINHPSHAFLPWFFFASDISSGPSHVSVIQRSHKSATSSSTKASSRTGKRPRSCVRSTTGYRHFRSLMCRKGRRCVCSRKHSSAHILRLLMMLLFSGG
ncbi:AAA domain-containing protein [Fimicolochytrium jonesii]|uniref:AAA domain-containing protein n=1 Tax=Fimicolochytrium jonesii TaxID=1396493 RepID=UPI0022FE6C4C|nr:AAA domain-containing protein [Fimicolochytrium jonesii]KAI8819486.1 AAA domain-containing protein [Fimicolochytrium jonesii]